MPRKPRRKNSEPGAAPAAHPVVNMLAAKSTLSKLIAALESKGAAEITIARNGQPVARLLPIERASGGVRLGVAKGIFTAPEIDPDLDRAAAALFLKSP